MPALAFLGCLQYLEHVGLLQAVDTFVGSSAGAVVGFMTVMGFRPREAFDFFMASAIQTHNVNELDCFDAMFGQQTCLETLGLDDGGRWMAFLKDALKAKYGCSDITFGELAKITGKVFVVCVTNLTKVRREYLSVDTTPEMSVLLAVRMSLSVPILYAPVLHEGSMYVDGSLLDNFPVASTTTSKLGPPTTVAFFIRTILPAARAEEETDDRSRLLPSPLEYLGLLLGAVMSHAQSNNGNSSDSETETHIIRVGVPIVSEETATGGGFSLRSLSFNVNRERSDELIAKGYAAARERLESTLGDILLWDTQRQPAELLDAP